MHILKTDFNGSPNVGLYGYTTDKYLLLGESLTDALKKQVQEVLGVDILEAKIAGTSMPGLFLVGNSKCVLAPHIIFDTELANLKKLKIPIQTIETQQTCLGNNIVCNDHGAIISPSFSESEREIIEKHLGVPTVQKSIADFSSPGAFIVLNGDKGIIHRDATEDERAEVEKILNVTLSPATTNLGTPYLHAAILSNTNGFIIGGASGGPEIVHIDLALGYMEDE